MWYKHFNKSSWQLRLFRNKNLTFKYNDLGFNANMYASNFRNGVMRVFGHEAPLRVFSIFFVITMSSFYLHFNEKFYGEKNKKKEEE